MAIFTDFLKFICFEEAIPFKNEAYVWRVIYFRKLLVNAHIENDWKTLLQFRCFYAILSVFFGYCFYLYRTNLNKINSYIQIDYLNWIGLNSTIYFFICLFVLVVMYYLHVHYSLPIAGSLFRSVEELLTGSELSAQHWPFHYKYQHSTKVTKKFFFLMLKVFQGLIVVMGKLEILPKRLSKLGFFLYFRTDFPE